jgi:hypothetical protein
MKQHLVSEGWHLARLKLTLEKRKKAKQEPSTAGAAGSI